jgi:hypothetical protein
MAQNLIRRDEPPAQDLHPRVILATVGFSIWFVLAAFAGFAVDAYSGYLLMFVALIFGIGMALPFLMFLAWKKGHRGDGHDDFESRSFHDWAERPLATWQDRVKGMNAATEVLIPMGAAALGMTAFGIVFHLAR